MTIGRLCVRLPYRAGTPSKAQFHNEAMTLAKESCAQAKDRVVHNV